MYSILVVLDFLMYSRNAKQFHKSACVNVKSPRKNSIKLHIKFCYCGINFIMLDVSFNQYLNTRSLLHQIAKKELYSIYSYFEK